MAIVTTTVFLQFFMPRITIRSPNLLTLALSRYLNTIYDYGRPLISIELYIGCIPVIIVPNEIVNRGS